MPDHEYEVICEKVWRFYEETRRFAPKDNGKRNILFPPPRRNRPVDLLVVGISPLQTAPVTYTHTLDGLKDFARSFRYISGGDGAAGQHYDAYYLVLLSFLRRADERFGVWWEVEHGTHKLLVEFTDALHVATKRGNDDLNQFLGTRVQGGAARRDRCKEILELELAYYKPRVVMANGRLPSDLLWEICTGRPLRSSPTDCMVNYTPTDSTVHLSGFLTSQSMDGYSKARLLKELKAHSPF